MVTSENATNSACLGTNLSLEPVHRSRFLTQPQVMLMSLVWTLRTVGVWLSVLFLFIYLFIYLFIFAWCLLPSRPALSGSFLDIHFTEPVTLTCYEILLGSHVILVNKADFCFDSGTLIFFMSTVGLHTGGSVNHSLCSTDYIQTDYICSLTRAFPYSS